MSFFEELKRRNVVRVGIAYVLLGWVVLQAADFGLDLIDAPNWIIQALFIIGLTGLPVALFFAWAFELTPEGIKREADVDRSTSITPHTGRKLDRAIIAFLALAVVLLLGDRFLGSGDRAEPTSVPESTATAEAPVAAAPDDAMPPPKSVAVLPFADLSQDQDQEWFADGLAEEILNALARTPDLLVASRTSAFSYKGENTPISQIAEELGVAHVLEGSVRSGAGRIRVTAQLIRTRDGFHVWSENYDRAPEDMIAIQEDLALSIARALETTMDPEQLEGMSQVGTRSVEAYLHYLRGVASGSANFRDDSDILVTLEHFQAATDTDPRFAAAYLRQASWWKEQLTPSYIYSGATGLSVEEIMERFTLAIDAAIEHADGEVDRSGYLAQKAEVEVRLRDAIELYGQYLEQRPHDQTAILGLLTAADIASDPVASERAMNMIRERGKRDPEAAVFYLSTAYDSQDPDEVADYGLERLEGWPDQRGVLYQTHRALAWAGRVEEAAAIARRYELSYATSALMVIRQACLEGRTADAEAAFANIDQGDDDRWRTQAWLALKIMGRDEEAARALLPIAGSSSPYQLASTLSYGVFDPTPYPALMNIIERENIRRAPPIAIPYACPPPDETSIAVLPFVNMSEDADYFADGISEEILNTLAQVPDLKVAGRTSAFAFKGRNEDLRVIGEALGVNHILEGSVRRAGDRVRITAQLIKADDGFHLWSETFDRELVDVFAIQDEIASAILEALETTLLSDDQLAATVVDIAAYDRFLEARKLMLGRDEASVKRAAAMLDEVRSMAPDYAPAHAQRAIAELLLSDRTGAYGTIPVPVAIANAEPLIEQALALNPEQIDAIAARGLTQLMARRFEEASSSLKAALALNPNHPNANNWLHLVNLAKGEFRAGYENALRLNEIDPLYPPVIGNLAFYDMMFGQAHRSAARIDRAEPYLQGTSKSHVQGVRAFVESQTGQAARILLDMGDRQVARSTWAGGAAFWSLAFIGEYERALPYAEGMVSQTFALMPLGRSEEALKLAQSALIAGQGVPELIAILAELQRWQELVDFVESSFESIEDLERSYFSEGFGANELGHLSYAYRQLGQFDKADEALRAFRRSLQWQLGQGLQNPGIAFSQALLAMLEQDIPSALGHLETGEEVGLFLDDNFYDRFVVFKPLQGEERLQTLLQRIYERRNEQRALLDLPPLELGA